MLFIKFRRLMLIIFLFLYTSWCFAQTKTLVILPSARIHLSSQYENSKLNTQINIMSEAIPEYFSDFFAEMSIQYSLSIKDIERKDEVVNIIKKYDRDKNSLIIGLHKSIMNADMFLYTEISKRDNMEILSQIFDGNAKQLAREKDFIATNIFINDSSVIEHIRKTSSRLVNQLAKKQIIKFISSPPPPPILDTTTIHGANNKEKSWFKNPVYIASITSFALCSSWGIIENEVILKNKINEYNDSISIIEIKDTRNAIFASKTRRDIAYVSSIAIPCCIFFGNYIYNRSKNKTLKMKQGNIYPQLKFSNQTTNYMYCEAGIVIQF